MINTAALTGRLTKDPELRYTGTGIAVLSFTLAVNKRFKQEGQDDADFIQCQAWRGTAETIANYCKKGSLIGIEGRIQTRNYQDNDSKTVYVTEVIVENMSFLESKNSNQNQNSTQNNMPNMNNAQGSGMSVKRSTNNDPFESNAPDISDDDLPFDLAPMK